MSYMQLIALKLDGTNQPGNFSNLIDVFCLLVSVLSNSTVFNIQNEATNCLRNYWPNFPLAVHRLINNGDWVSMKKIVSCAKNRFTHSANYNILYPDFRLASTDDRQHVHITSSKKSFLGYITGF